MTARRYLLNACIALIVAVITLDTLPQSPGALRRKLTPILARLGINQGPWELFAPDPDRINSRLSAEITYHDGEKRTWHGPDWSTVSIWEKWVGHRRLEWDDHIVLRSVVPTWGPWCRHLARVTRPELPNADRGAEVQVFCSEAITPPAEEKPWPSSRQPPVFTDRWVLTIEKFP
jgi:hypothetical protein